MSEQHRLEQPKEYETNRKKPKYDPYRQVTMFDINLFKRFPNEIIKQILDHDCLSFDDVYIFLFNKSTHQAAQHIINNRCLAHVCIGRRKNYESVITSTYDNEITRGPHYWHIHHNFHSKQVFAQWVKNHNNLNNYAIQIFIDQYPAEELNALRLLQHKNLKIYLNWEDDDLNTVQKFNTVVWPRLTEIFDLVNNRVKMVLEYENVVDESMTFNLTNLQSFEWRYYYSIGETIEITSSTDPTQNTIEQISINSSNSIPLSVKFTPPFPNLIELKIKAPLEHPNQSLQVLHHCPRLQKLCLERAYHGTIQSFLCNIPSQGLQNLKTLDLISNYIGDIRNINFAQYFPSLENLMIKFENEDPSQKFEFSQISLPQTLQTLDLQAKRIHTFNVIAGPKYLARLDLSYNYPLNFNFDNTFEAIKELKLNYNRSIISSIYRFNLFDITNFIFFKVEELHLLGCNINNEDLEALDVKYSQGQGQIQQHSAKGNLLPRSSLRKLSLANNKITNLRCFKNDLFGNMTSLESIDLSFNAFYYLNNDNFPLSKTKFPNLLNVNLTGNSRLTSVRLVGDYPRVETTYTPVKQDF